MIRDRVCHRRRWEGVDTGKSFTGSPAMALIEEELTSQVLAGAVEVHKTLGPGLLESTYRKCLVMELAGRGLTIVTEAPIAAHYKGVCLENSFRADLIVEGRVLVVLKSVERLLPLH